MEELVLHLGSGSTGHSIPFGSGKRIWGGGTGSNIVGTGYLRGRTVLSAESAIDSWSPHLGGAGHQSGWYRSMDEEASLHRKTVAGNYQSCRPVFRSAAREIECSHEMSLREEKCYEGNTKGIVVELCIIFAYSGSLCSGSVTCSRLRN